MEERWRRLSGHLFREIEAEGTRYRYFGGTAYLGIPQHAAFRELYLEGLRRFGLNNGTSRNNNIQLGIYDEAEQVAAKRFDAPAALITSSGYHAAQLTIRCLTERGTVRYAPATHPALWKDQQPATKGSFASWANKLIDEINKSEEQNWVIISNSVNNLFPEVYDFSFLKAVHGDRRIILIVDDSHGIGIINKGKGAFLTLPETAKVSCIVIASMAKALGVDAGLVLGSPPVIEQLKQTHGFLGASPPSAAGLFAFIQGGTIYDNEWKILNQLTEKLAAELTGRQDWSFSPQFPVFLSKNPNIAEQLLDQKILISSFPYPDKNGNPINRIVLSSWHTPADIEELILALK